MPSGRRPGTPAQWSRASRISGEPGSASRRRTTSRGRGRGFRSGGGPGSRRAASIRRPAFPGRRSPCSPETSTATRTRPGMATCRSTPASARPGTRQQPRGQQPEAQEHRPRRTRDRPAFGAIEQRQEGRRGEPRQPPGDSRHPVAGQLQPDTARQVERHANLEGPETENSAMREPAGLDRQGGSPPVLLYALAGRAARTSGGGIGPAGRRR